MFYNLMNDVIALCCIQAQFRKKTVDYTTRIIQNVSYSMSCTTDNIQHAMFTTCFIEYVSYIISHKTCLVQYVLYNMYHTGCLVKHVSTSRFVHVLYSIYHTARLIQHVLYNLICRTTSAFVPLCVGTNLPFRLSNFDITSDNSLTYQHIV